MKHILVELLSQMTTVSKEEEAAIEEAFAIKTYAQDDYLLREGQTAHAAFYIVKGCVREFELKSGEEKTTAFYTEHQSAVNFDSLANSRPSENNLICAEETTVVIFDSKKEKALYDRFPRFGALCREGTEKALGEKHKQLTEFITLKPEERYLKLQNERPDLLNRVPQYQIASYLGIKPETLSRIRKRLLANAK